tara:strand:- start:76 stop:531 length:456 start_codon:yes stop_codon:yes gene_type:complete
MADARAYSSRRINIIEALADKLKMIDGQGAFLSDVNDNVVPRLKFWDEVEEFPAIHLNPGVETRQYQAGGFKDRFLGITVRVYVHEEDAQVALGRLLEDIETVVEENSSLNYRDNLNILQSTHQISVISITTDEGVLEPLGVAEMELEVRY